MATDGDALVVPPLLDRPGHAPELLALTAVRTLGPRAQAWAAQTRAAYPLATPDGLARLATQRFVRVAGVGGVVSAVSGLFAPLAELAATSWTQAALVLHLAAAYGHDPTARERAVDLLVLTRVHPTPEAASAALATAEESEPDDQPAWRAAEALWRVAAPLASQTSGWLALRLVARALPGARAVVAGAGGVAVAERLAGRARALYRTNHP
ncbi:hypothetical protein WEI85_03190 [Actinomycetes bacterium KLBMP 9797]